VIAAVAAATLACAGCGGSSHLTHKNGSSKLGLSAFLVQGDEAAPMSYTGDTPSPMTGAGYGEGLQASPVSGPSGVSDVAPYRSAAAAARDVPSEIKASGFAGTPQFEVPGIPGATGVSDNKTGDVWFIEGRCEITIGDQFSSAQHQVSMVRLPLIHAADAIWARTHGKRSVCST
jgi:hypothetical protein